MKRLPDFDRLKAGKVSLGACLQEQVDDILVNPDVELDLKKLKVLGVKVPRNPKPCINEE